MGEGWAGLSLRDTRPIGGSHVDRAAWMARIEKTEAPLLWLAGVAVVGYLMDLNGLWSGWGLQSAYEVSALVIDLVFVGDLVVKTAVGGRAYLRSPWFVVDLVCALPALATVWTALSSLQGLRFVRMFRLLRALRMLRVLRAMRMIRMVKLAGETPEQRTYQRVLVAAVLGYAALFVALVSSGDGDAQRELWLVVGSLLGMGLMLLVTRFQVPAMFSQQVRQLLNVALPGRVAEHFMSNPEAYDHSVRMPATVIFCDIKGFTSTVERIPLEELKSNLEAALDAVVDAHLAQDLLIDKFIGDAVMSFRGGNLVEGDASEHAYRVVRGALDGARALAALGNPYFSEIKVGGASASDALIGTFGTSKRLSYTILGDRVNLAARLEGSCNAFGVGNLFCDRTRSLIGDTSDLSWRRVGAIRVQGKQESTVAWEVFDADQPTDWIAGFDAALAQWEAGRPAEALAGFRAVLEARPEDGPSALYAEACEVLVAGGVPDGWEPVLATKK